PLKSSAALVCQRYISDREGAVNNLLIKFKSKDSPFGVTRETLKAIAEEMVGKTMAVPRPYYVLPGRCCRPIRWTTVCFPRKTSPMSATRRSGRCLKGRCVRPGPCCREGRAGNPAPGDIFWCRFRQRPRDLPGQKPRPALVLTVAEHEDGVVVTVAYGTSQKLDRMVPGEFAIRKGENKAVYALAGLSYDTKFDLRNCGELPWNDSFFAVPNGRTTQIFINLRDNSATHDKEPFTPFGKIIEGLEVADKLNAEYGETSGGGIRGGKQAPLFEGGNAWLKENFPRLDYIIKTSVANPIKTRTPAWRPNNRKKP
ncbi:MAG TPA: type II toxin-antitoxin system PemK/MazF family toxin, partial [Blastocatellia bacterium]|nr:type II toxin-antitoxin system PemK/MazF family toxin [Blastocatellia bacterium]